MNEDFIQPWHKHKTGVIAAIIIILAVAWYLNRNQITPMNQAFSLPSEDSAEPAFLEQAEPFAPADKRAATLTPDRSATNETVNGQPTTLDRKVIKVGTLDLIVSQTEAAATQVQEIAGRLGGLTQYVQIYGAGRDKKIGTVTVKVPVARFNEAVDAIKQLADEVENLTVNTNDVTEQYIDLAARIKNMRAEEEQYQNILKQTAKVEEILQVTERLSNVRTRIEQAEGQLKYLSEQVDLSTITVNLSAEGDIEVLGIHWRPSVTVRQSIRDLLVSLTGYADAMIKFAFYLPVFLIWLITVGVGFILALWTVKRLKQNIRK